jgi:hypothetical protein
MVNEPALHHINELVVAVGVGLQKEEPRVNQIADGVEDDSLHDFAIEELETHPYAMDDGRPGMKIQMLVIRVPLEAVYIEDGLDVLDGDLLDNMGFETANMEGLRGAGGGVA